MEYSSPDAVDEDLVSALEQAEKLCSQVNEGLRLKENTEQLEWLQSHVQFTLSEVRITSSISVLASWAGGGGMSYLRSKGI